MAIKKGKDVKEKKVKKTKEKPEKKGKKAKAEKEPKVKKGKKGRVIDGDTGEVLDDDDGIALRAHAASEDMDAMLDAIEKDVGIVAVTAGSRNTTSTGLLSLDLMLCGGLVSGGWYTFFGGEQSSKSTLAMTQIARAAMQGKIPILLYFDFEGSLSESLDYMLSIARAQGFKGNLQDLFGIQDPKTGKYVKKPLIRRYQESVAERFFDLVAKLERSLPDKLYRNEKWWYVYEHTKVNISKYSAISDKQLYKQTGKLWVETDNGHPQAMIVVDSYPAMLPERLDEDDAGAGMAAQARMFSDNIKRVKGKMSSKRIVIMGVNQLRKAPMVKYGCLHGDTQIPFVDGTSHSIKSIVEQKIEGEVWSLNEDTDKIEPAKITGWFNNGEVDKKSDWITITTTNVVETPNGVASVTVTPDHKILTRRGWKAARKLKVGDKVLSKYASIYEGEMRSVLAGVLAGDSCIVGDCRNSHLRLQDSQNAEYVAWKRDLLKDVLSFNLRGTKKQTWISNRYYQLSKLKEKLGERDPTKFANVFDARSLAIFYMDDGHFRSERNTSSICIGRFKGKEKLEQVAEMLSEKFCVSPVVRGKNLMFSAEDTRVMHSLIAKYVPEPMQYKLLPEYRGKYKAHKLKAKISTKNIWCEISSIDKGSDRKFRSRTKYDIEVASHSNYMAGNVANGFIVHNSPEYEPGGEAVKFFSDVRIRMASRSVLGGTGQIEEEPSVEKPGGKDVYRYVNMRAAKNKLSVPNLEGWARIWVRDAYGKARGYDPVFDTFTFLKELKLISGTKKNLVIKLKEFEGSKGLTWAQFKMLCIGEKKMVLQVFKDAKIKAKPFKLRERLFKMVSTGKATETYFAALADGSGKDKDDEAPSDE